MTKQIFNDGVHNISNEQYHEAEGISRSKLLLFDKSPYHFWYEVYSGLAKKRASTCAMDFGSAFHTMLLEPELFGQHFCVAPKMDRRTSKGKQDYSLFTQENCNKTILTDEQYEKAWTMSNHLKQNDVVSMLLSGAVFEQSIFWTDPETGLQFKARPDIWSSKMIVDLKTSSDTSLNAFTWSALNYGYYLQAGMAFEACRSIGKPLDMFVILAVEKDAPFVPSVFILDQKALEFGIDQFNVYKKRLRRCLDCNQWDGYKVQELSVPDFAKDKLEQVA